MHAVLNEREPVERGESPWGRIEVVERIADGIVSVSTSRHGGLWVAPALRTHPVLACSPVTSGWYEEDVEWMLVVLAYPERFTPRLVFHAVASIESPRAWEPLRAAQRYLFGAGSSHYATLKSIAQGWKQENALRWERGSMGTRGDGWWITFTRVGDGARAERYCEGDALRADEDGLFTTLPGVPLHEEG